MTSWVLEFEKEKSNHVPLVSSVPVVPVAGSWKHTRPAFRPSQHFWLVLGHRFIFHLKGKSVVSTLKRISSHFLSDFVNEGSDLFVLNQGFSGVRTQMQTPCSTICAVLDLFSDSVCILGWFLFFTSNLMWTGKISTKRKPYPCGRKNYVCGEYRCFWHYEDVCNDSKTNVILKAHENRVWAFGPSPAFWVFNATSTVRAQAFVLCFACIPLL